jgi:hypothetical protein
MRRREGGGRAANAKPKQGVILFAAAIVSAGPVQAFEIAAGSDDIQVRWDNTIRYNLATRAKDMNEDIAASLNNNDGDRNFDKTLVSNRLDLLSEFDFIYRRDTGFRVSGAAWGDDAYSNLDDHSAVGSNHLVNGAPATGLSDTTERYNRGVSGEVLDAFAFTMFDLGSSPLYLKAGRHTVYWGESLYSAGAINGIAYAQSPLDISKALQIPGAEAQELFRPLNNVSANLQATETLSLAAQYFFDWEPFRFPEAGSYLSSLDFVMDGGESIYTPMGLLTRLDDVEPDERGDLGVSARWSPDWLDGTVGFYYRNFSDKVPSVVLDVRGNPLIGGTPGEPVGYRLSYGDDIDLFGISLSKQIGGISVGAELSYRENMPLVSDPVIIASPTTVALAQAGTPGLEAFVNAQTALPGKGESGGARGNTVHAVLNFIGQVATTSWFDSLDWQAELTWNTWTKVTEHEELFLGRDGYTGINRPDKSAWTIALNIEPKWYSVLPSVDMVLPLSYKTGISGNSAVAIGGNENAGSFSAGIGIDLRNRYRFDLKYVGFFGDIDATNPTAVVGNGPESYLKDRDMLLFTFNTTF